MNFERLVYIGDREKISKWWKRRHYIFIHGKAIAVPDDFAEVLLKTPHFIPEAQAGRPMDEVWPKGAKLLVRRWGAMGDLIIFRAAVSAFLRTTDLPFDLVIRLQTRFAHMFVHDELWAGTLPIGTSGQSHDYEGVVTFDQVAEQDHRGREEHRLDLFLEAMTKRSITVTPDDWKIPLPQRVLDWTENYLSERGIHPDQRDCKLIAVQLRGSGAMKTLPSDVIFMIIGRLRAAGHQVILIENDERVALQYEFDEDTYYMVGRDVLHGMAMLKYVDLAITMDSGALWMAHVAACPTLVILGPTRPKERIAKHPLFPDQARAVCLNEIIDCPACFESGAACSQKYTCMQAQPDWNHAVGRIMSEAESILAGERQAVSIPVAFPVASNKT